jgi:polygalacturonase
VHGRVHRLYQRAATELSHAEHPYWQHHPTGCSNVAIDGVFADSVGPNNDGFNPDACNNVLVQNVQFNTGDDCIAIKSGKCLDAEYGPMQNIVVQNCTM